MRCFCTTFKEITLLLWPAAWHKVLKKPFFYFFFLIIIIKELYEGTWKMKGIKDWLIWNSEILINMEKEALGMRSSKYRVITHFLYFESGGIYNVLGSILFKSLNVPQLVILSFLHVLKIKKKMKYDILSV